MSNLLPGDATDSSSRYAAADGVGVAAGSGDDGPMVMFLRRKYIASEADGTVRVEVIRVGDSSQQCSVYVSTAKIAGISSAGEDDYVPIKDKELIFPAGETLQAVDITLVNNDRWEEVELFMVVLEHPHNARLGPLISARVAIADDDLYPKGCQTTGWGLIKAFIQEQVAERGVKFYKTAAALIYIGMFSTIDALILKLVIDNALGQAPSDILTGGSETAAWTTAEPSSESNSAIDATPVAVAPGENAAVTDPAALNPCGAVGETAKMAERHPKVRHFPYGILRKSQMVSTSSNCSYSSRSLFTALLTSICNQPAPAVPVLLSYAPLLCSSNSPCLFSWGVLTQCVKTDSWQFLWPSPTFSSLQSPTNVTSCS